MPGQWLLSTLTGDDTAHAVPLDDVIVHGFAADCPCGPTARPVPRDDGSMGWLYVHHSLDGREAAEA
jgi:hypothetical protein